MSPRCRTMTAICMKVPCLLILWGFPKSAIASVCIIRGFQKKRGKNINVIDCCMRLAASHDYWQYWGGLISSYGVTVGSKNTNGLTDRWMLSNVLYPCYALDLWHWQVHQVASFFSLHKIHPCSSSHPYLSIVVYWLSYNRCSFLLAVYWKSFWLYCNKVFRQYDRKYYRKSLDSGYMKVNRPQLVGRGGSTCL